MSWQIRKPCETCGGLDTLDHYKNCNQTKAEPTGKFCSTNCCINKALYYYDQCEEHLVTPEPVELEKVFVFENDHTFESLGSAPFNVLQCKHCDKFASHHLAYATRSTLTTLINKEVERKSLEAREIYVPIHGTEGRYEVSNFGNVRSVPGGRRKGGVLKQSLRSKKVGYKTVTLCKGSLTQSELVHRLVAKAFLSNPDEKPCVNHIDGDPGNNRVGNLEWCTYSENELHAYKLGKRNSQARLTEKQVNGIRERLKNNNESYSSIAKDYGVHLSLVYQIQKGLIWKTEQLKKLKEGL